MSLPKFELRYPVATAVTVDVVEIGGGGTSNNITVAAVSTTGYYLTGTGGLLDLLVTALNADATLTGVYSAVLDDTSDAATGKATIALDSGATSFTLAFDDTSYRNWLGFTGDLTPTGTTFTGANQAAGLWLPNCGRGNTIGPEPTSANQFAGEVSGAIMAVAPSGMSFYANYGRRSVERFTFSHIIGFKAFITNETVVNESAQRFWRNACDVAGMVARYHADRTSDTVYLECRLDWPSFADSITAVNPAWVGPRSLHAINFGAIAMVT